MQELHLNVVVDSTFPAVIPGAVAFETGATQAEVEDPSSFAYEHHGEGFTSSSSGALTRFFEDLIRGAPMPLTFATHRIAGIDTVVAAALFLQRDLAIHPGMPGLVIATDLVHRHGPSMLGHVDADLVGLFTVLRDYFPDGISKQEMGDRLSSGVQWVRDFLVGGTTPQVNRVVVPRIIDIGSDGFVLADSDNPSLEAWVELFRRGHLRGVLLGPDRGGFRSVVAARKSPRVNFDLARAQLFLNELEIASGGNAEWRVEGEFLFGPAQGSLVLPSHMVQVFLRV